MYSDGMIVNSVPAFSEEAILDLCRQGAKLAMYISRDLMRGIQINEVMGIAYLAFSKRFAHLDPDRNIHKYLVKSISHEVLRGVAKEKGMREKSKTTDGVVIRRFCKTETPYGLSSSLDGWYKPSNDEHRFLEQFKQVSPYLTTKDRLLCLLMYRGYKPNQIARALDCNEHQFKRMVYRLRKKVLDIEYAKAALLRSNDPSDLVAA